MQIVTGTVVEGKVVLDGASLPEGTVVTVVAQQSVRLPPHLQAELEEAIDDADREADDVELTRVEQTGVLRHLAPDERAAGVATSLRHPRDDLVDLLGDELAHGDVVEEEQRLGAVCRDVVGRHRDAVDADGVRDAHLDREQHLGPDAVGATHEHRITVVALEELLILKIACPHAQASR